MNKMKRYLILLMTAGITVSSASGCQLSDKKAQIEFDTFIRNDFIESMESNWINAHVFMENPQNYGVDIDCAPVEFGKVMSDTVFQDEVEKTQVIRDKFDQFDRRKLTDQQKDVYDVMAYQLEVYEQQLDKKFRNIDFVFATFTGLPAQIPQILADLQLRNEDDVQRLILLIQSTRGLIDECLDGLKQQAKQGTMMIDCDAVADYSSQFVEAGENGSTLQSILNHIGESKLDEKRIRDYQNQAREAYMTSFIPAFEDIIEVVTELKSADQTEGGLACIENGKEYYELLFRRSVGTSKSMDEVKSLLEATLNQELEKIQRIAADDYDALAEWVSGDITTQYTDYKEPLKDLAEAIGDDFPEIDRIDYEIEALPHDRENDTVSAYYNLPPLDDTWPQTIYVNSMADALNIDSLDTFSTLAHEGFPGHMYATNYIYGREDITDWMKTVGSNTGFTEGYATYAGMYALNYLEDIDENIIAVQNSMTVIQDMFIAMADIGIHYDGWSLADFEKKMEAYGMDVTMAEEVFTQIRANPTAFAAYYVGYAEIARLRQWAETELGDQFSEREFHEALLKSGNTIFDVAERNIGQYIRDTKKY